METPAHNPGRSRLAGPLFWFMVLLGGAILAPCLILPAWLEYQAALELRDRQEARVRRLEAEVLRLRKQREHLETDEAYVLRLARKHFALEIPGLERIPIVFPEEANPGAGRDNEQTEDPIAATASEDELLPDVSTLVARTLARYPLAGMFVWPQTRPPLMLIGGGLILSAILLLGNPDAG